MDASVDGVARYNCYWEWTKVDGGGAVASAQCLVCKQRQSTGSYDTTRRGEVDCRVRPRGGIGFVMAWLHGGGVQWLAAAAAVWAVSRCMMLDAQHYIVKQQH